MLVSEPSTLLHGPYSQFGLGREDWEVWKAIEEIHRSGGVRMIGVSNVNARQLSTLVERAAVKPMVVQNRCFASRGWDREVRRLCAERGIASRWPRRRWPSSTASPVEGLA
jgi:diketogulonate reductase-like aldo/keto reductase